MMSRRHKAMRLIDANAIRYNRQMTKKNKRDELWIEVMVTKKEIDSMPTISVAPKWIPVEERLPEESGLYLVTTTDGDVYEAYIDEILHLFSRFESDGFYILDNVDAWMPLPDPYEGERKDDE